MTDVALASPARREAFVGRALALVARLPLARLRVGPLADDIRWLLPIAIGAYVVGTTWTWEFPDWRGVPFPPIYLGLVVTLLVAWQRRVGAIGPLAAAAIVAAAARAMPDVTSVFPRGLRDIGISLKAGARWLQGLPVYAQVPIDKVPDALSNSPSLYPPMTLLLFGLLSALPF